MSEGKLEQILLEQFYKSGCDDIVSFMKGAKVGAEIVVATIVASKYTLVEEKSEES